MSEPIIKGSLSLAPGYVTDAFQLASATPFKPENIVFGEYTFLPWVRTGLATALEPPAADAVRALVHISVTVQDDNGTRVDVPAQTLTLRGPGDVIGFDSGQIIRRYPANGSIDAEESLLAHIEFDRPELPWLFSPLPAPNDQLRPWIALVVCDAAAVLGIEPGPPGFPPQLRTLRGELQPLDDSWAWAHAQIVGPAGDPQSRADRLSAEHGPTNLSRLLCPRKLASLHSYIACLVPAFDCGVQAATGSGGGTLEPAWTRAADGSDAGTEITLPIFDTWSFSIAPAGDFELLAGRLRGVPAPWNVGRKLIDAHLPRGGLPELPEGAPGEVQVLRCALVSPAPMPPELPSENSAWEAPIRDKLRLEIDRVNANSDEDLPRVGPRLYARFQRGQAALGPVFGVPPNNSAAADADWFSELNTSPLPRIVAGLGTRVVQRDQEELMQVAWAQIGDVRKVNETLVRIQFGRFVGEALHRNHLAKLELGALSQVLRGVQDKVRASATTLTFHGKVSRSAVAPAAMTGAFRRLSRVRGPLARFAGRDGTVALRQLVAAGGSYRDFRRLYVEPDGILSLSESAIAAIPRALLAAKLGVSEARAPRVLQERLAARSSEISVADRLAQPLASWPLREGTIDLGQRAAAEITERVTTALPRSFAAEPSRSEALSPLLVGIGNARVPEVSTRSKATLTRIGRRLPFSPRPSSVGMPLNIGATRSVQAMGRPVALQVTAAPATELPAGVRFETEISRQITAAVMGTQAVSNRSAAAAVSQLVAGTGVAALPRTPDRPALDFTRDLLLSAVAPAITVTAYAKSRLRNLPSWLAPDWFADGRIAPIMAAPRFDRAMFEALDAYDRNWLIPGLEKIEFTDFVTTLQTNPQFTESFLVGLSDEMGRELLWRGYPTDQRGTYFYRFWNQDHDELTEQIHRFKRTPLGTHLAGGANARVVLVVRGEVVRRYPDVVFHALRTTHADEIGRPVFADPADDPSSVATILFHHHLPPDLLLVGFDLSPQQVRTEPWWFLIAENPSAPRFGLDLPTIGNQPASDGAKRNDLDWNDLGALREGRFLSASARIISIKDEESTPPAATWPGNAAIVARTLLQNPVRAAFDAHKLIAPALPV